MAHNKGVSLTQVHPSPDAGVETDIDIIAIHGLDTKSPDTWTWKCPDEDVNWLTSPQMLPRTIGRARIFTCDWPADLFEKPDLVQKEFLELARLLLAGIQQRPHPNTSYTKGKDRPIVFIASCLGGIILMKALWVAHNSPSDYIAIIRSTRGIVFLATPFRGTSFQDVANWAEPGLKVWASVKGKKVSTLLDIVKGSTFDLEELVCRFTQLYQDNKYPCHIRTFYETGMTNLYRKFPLSWLIPSWLHDLYYQPKPLVDRFSANLGIVTDPLCLNRCHVMMNKFSNAEDPDYKRVAGKIEKILLDIRTNSPLDDPDTWIRNKCYTPNRLEIERLSGEKLSMNQCYINLAIVEQRGQIMGRLKKGDVTLSPFSLFDRQKVKTPDHAIQVQLATIFNERRISGGTIQPRRILIRGRAGVGKTTLCKKIVHEFTQGTWTEWSNLFDRILWVPLRNLKLDERRQQSGYNFECLFTDEYFSRPNKKPDFAKQLARELELNSSKTLFLLDGLDEVSQDLAGNDSMSCFLNDLLEQPNIIITSRPSGRLPFNLDLELEAIGFYPDQVTGYIKKTFTNPNTTEIDEKTVDKIQDFLRDHWLIQGLVRIPIQLDALCYSWRAIRSDMPETMTALYQAIELSLWKKDIVRLEKTHNHALVTLYHIQDASRQKIEEFVQDEISFLESLAFAGLHSDRVEFEPKHLNFISDRVSDFLPSKIAPSLSFLRTSNPSSEYRNRSYHFIHLTFQEYFAARYFVRQWTAGKSLNCVQLSSGKIDEIDPVKFFQKHKYTARYDILWRFVTGLLDAERDKISSFLHAIEEEPLDLLGPTHQRLVMHCLSEVSSSLPMRTNLEQRLSEWLLFECEFRGSCELANEPEFPKQILDTVFCEGSDEIKKTILKWLTKRVTIPANIVKAAASWLDHKDDNARWVATIFLQRLDLPDEFLELVAAKLEDKAEVIREAAIKILGQRSTLPDDIFKAIAARLEDKAEVVQEAAIKSLGQRSALPNDILKAIAARLEDKAEVIREAAITILGQRSALPNNILKAVAVRLKDKDEVIREAAIKSLGQQSALPDDIFKAVAARLEDEDQRVRIVAIWALGQQSALPDDILKAIAARLEDKAEVIREAAIKSLGQQSALPDDIFEAVAARLDHKIEGVQEAVIEVLGRQSSLPNEICKAIRARLDHESENIQKAAIEALGWQSNLPDEFLKAIAAKLDHKSESIQTTAIRALGCQLSLPDEFLKAIVAQLSGDKPAPVRVDALMALSCQVSLPDEFLKAIVAQLSSDEPAFVRMAAIGVLERQSKLPDEFLKAIVAQLSDIRNMNVRGFAITALKQQSSLSDEILKFMAAQLVDHGGGLLNNAIIKFLGQRSSSLDEILKSIAAQLKNDKSMSPAFPSSAETAETVLRKHKSFYYTLIKSSYVTFLYKALLKRSFKEQLSWYIDDNGNSCINTPEDIIIAPIDEQYDIRAVVKEARPANFPAV